PETEKIKMHSSVYPEVILSDYDEEGENKILASMLFLSGGGSLEHYISLLNKSSDEYKYSLLKPLFKEMKAYHPLPRFFEFADLTFQVECSASAYAQLKRHRMTVQISQHYNPELGYTVPPVIKSSGLEDLIAKAYEISTKLFYKIHSEAGQAAQYILTNAHRRRILVKLDIRELYHISRLREDKYAQWEIRRVAEKMVELARDKYPLVTLLACGKDRFTVCRQKLD
ncbi:MAG: FAD-dependent thymidylate synthase, partial [Spirochaetes bacterium]|nr:FAD-dependent thymidylate synthase [Spirochaetota bacterium]